MSFFFKQVLHPAWHAIKRDGVNEAVRKLNQNQWLSRAELLAIQQQKLGELLAFAGEHVPYYRELFSRSGINLKAAAQSEEFRRIPLLTKKIIRGEQNALVSERLNGNKLIANSTSGSTGQAIRFFTDSRSTARRTAAEMRSNAFTGWELGDRWVTLWGASMDMPKSKLLRSRVRGIANRRIFLSSFDLSSQRLREYAERILDYKPVLIVGYPGPLEQLALHCKNDGISFPTLNAIVSSAETLWPHQREVIEDAFGVKIFDRYGSREVGQVGGECEFHNGMHISVDRVLIEIVNDEDEPCGVGEAGRILVTDLDNFGMPLIRYDIGDRAVPAASGDCECGRGLPKVEKIEGRTLEVIQTPDGRRIGGTFWTLLLRSRPGLKQFQVVQDRPEGVVINFVRDDQAPAPAFAYFEEKIKDSCGSEFEVSFLEKDKIDLTSAGKQRLIISHIAAQPRPSPGVGQRSM